MSDINQWQWERPVKQPVRVPKDFREAAHELCEKALEDAKRQLHPLLQNNGLDRLSQRSEFLKAFKSALEQGIAQKLAVWQPGVQAVFKFDETPEENTEAWDGSIHLLVKVPRLSNAVQALGRKLDQGLVQYLKQLGWSHFRKRESILEIQQVTPDELRRGISYGAMFYAVYTVPIKVWPQNRRIS